ncbi:hypothetical protein CBR_g34249 [Chara braunii]|uniref:Uncharacterized protein n=1 Tax=Chara braunii TaxID=69332 RepID=A0A388JYN2_CHABU|nr:hypothetical protein CBR_g34249 [Chara braunii]|eukprot:GBG62877.1 hypothetical protein CBR_g34249 [Chara braunii]
MLAAIVPMEGLVLAGEFMERVRDLGKVANERVVIVGIAEEGTELEEGLGWGVLDEGFDLRGVHTDAFNGDNVAEVFDARRSKRTFAELGVKFLLSEDREDLAKVLKVRLEGGAEDKDVIKADDDTDFEEVAEDVVHGRLEGSGGIDAISMSGQCPGDCVHDEEGPALAEGGDVEVAGRVEADWRVNCAALGQLVCWCPNWRQRKQPPFAWR